MSVTHAYDALRKGLTGSVRRDEPMSRHTTYRIGGPAQLLIIADTVADLTLTTRILAEEGIEWTVLGKGSNVLVSDRGYDGAVLILGRDFKSHEAKAGHLRSGAGVILAHLVQDAFSKGLTGLEFAVGIPGTLGGALAMNAGTRDAWIGSIVESIIVLDPVEGLVGLRGPEIGWQYRSSGLTDRGIVLECVMRAEPGDKDAIRRAMETSFARRKKTQPVGLPCAGSVFVNPADDSAGRLIELCGLKGARVGGAMVSDVHANFIVNAGGATARDVLELMHKVRDVVFELQGIRLRPEIRFMGAFDGA